VDGDDDALTIEDLDDDERDDLRESLDQVLSAALAKKGFTHAAGDVGKLFAPPKATVSPAAAAALASFAVNTSGPATHEATVAAQRAGVDRINAETLAARTAERLAGRI